MKKRKYERYCADEGGLLHCNYDDANFVDALLDYVNTLPETKELLQVKTKYACEHLNFAKRCRDGGDFGDLLSECDRLWFEYIREKGLSERQLEETKGIFHSPRKVKGSTKLGIHLVTDDRVRTMLALRSKAKESQSPAMLVEVYADLANEVIAQIRTVLEDFVATRQYKTWLTERFPLPEDPEPEEDPGRSARDPASLERKSSWRFELPERHVYVLSGDARNACTHGVVCAPGVDDRESLNLRFGLHPWRAGAECSAYKEVYHQFEPCLLYTSPSPRD